MSQEPGPPWLGSCCVATLVRSVVKSADPALSGDLRESCS